MYGWWNEQLTSDRAFVTALKHIVKANVLAMQAILDVRPDAIFIQSESTEYFHAENPQAIKPAEILNARRFLSLDLNYGRRVDSEMYEYLMDNGMTREEYHFFLDNTLQAPLHHGQRLLRHQRAPRRAGGGITRRPARSSATTRSPGSTTTAIGLPVMHTETNFAEGPNGDEAVDWLWKEWANVLRVRNDGVPIVGFTWYSLTDQVDWDTALREDNGHGQPASACTTSTATSGRSARLQAADRATGARCCRPRASACTCRSCCRASTTNRWRPGAARDGAGTCAMS